MGNIKKSFNLALAFLPILGVYASFIPGISIGQLLLLICSIAVAVCAIKNKEFRINMPALLFVGYIFATSVLSLLSVYADKGVTLYTLASQLLFFAFLFVGHNAFDKEYFSKVYICLAVIVSALSIFQYIVFTLWGKVILFILPNVPLEIGVPYTRLVEVFHRVEGCFTEPAHLAQFLAVAVIFILSSDRPNKRDYGFLALILVACMLTMSGNAIMIIGVLGSVYVYYYIKEKKSLKKLAITAGIGLVAIVILYLSSDAVRALFWRITELTGTSVSASSGYFRTQRGYELFVQFPFLRQIFGIGCGNIGGFCSYYNIHGRFFVDSAHGMYTYLNGIHFYLTGGGIVGILLYTFMLLQGKGKSKTHTYSIWLLVSLSCFTALHGDVTWLILVTVTLSEKTVCKKYETTLHAILGWIRDVISNLTRQNRLKNGEAHSQFAQRNITEKAESCIMKENDVLLSVVIPTYNRYQYLKGCIESILIIKEQKLEVVIQDNTADNSEILPFIHSLNDSRVKYYHMPEHVTVSENSSNAVRNATGKYICMLGDDDSVCESLVELALQMDAYGIDAATYGISMYHWPDLLDRCPDLDALISPKFEGEIEKLDPHKLLMKELRNGMQEVYALPRAYHAIVSKDIMEKVRQQTGTYFPGPSPDMANAVGCALYAKNQIKIDVPMIISGYSNASAGGQGRQGQHKGSLKDKNWLPADVEETWTPKVPKLWLGSTIWPESAIKALEACDCGHYEEKMNYGAIYAETLYQDLSSWREVLSCHITVLDFCNMMVRIVRRVSKKLYKIVTREQKQEICVKERMSLLDAVNFQNELNANISIESLFEKAGNG